MARPRGMGLPIGLAFAGVALGTALIAVAILTAVWQQQFESYVRAGLQERANGMAAAIGQVYAAGREVPTLEIGHYGAMNQVRVQLLDTSGRLLADTASVEMGVFRSRISENGDAPSATAAVTANGRKVGSVRVYALTTEGVLGPRDIEFRQASLAGLVRAAILAVVLATLAGAVYARFLVRPINRVTKVAAGLRSGEKVRTGMQGGSPVGDLGRTLDEMADSIEADREFERRLTADVAHELRTPLQAIQAMVEGMQDGVIPANPHQLGIVRDETVRLARLADGILDLARLERGVVPFHMAPIDLAEVVHAAVETHSALFESSGIALSERVVPGLVVEGDADRLKQAIGNLLANAARYTPEGGSVEVRAFAEDGRAVIEVADTGVGIPADEVDKVFERFWRSDAARETSRGGLGVGLSVVREIVDRHEGSASVDSLPGTGSTFRIALPLAA